MAELLFLVFLVLCGHFVGTFANRRFAWQLDPAEASALGGMGLLAGFGWLIGVVGNWTLVVANPWLLVGVSALSAGCSGWWLSRNSEFEAPKPNPWWAAWALLLVFPLVKALSPSDMLDWDTIAYHFAVPKMWLAVGRMEHIPFIHQSNFPGIVDDLFIAGLRLGEGFAKILTVNFWVVGGLWVFGAARRRLNSKVAPFVALAFLASPLILWSSGSGYIDVAHGLFAAVGMLYAAEAMEDSVRRWPLLLLSGFGLGGAMGSKYTGLQVAFAALLVVAYLSSKNREWSGTWKPLLASGLLALIIACPWYIRTYQNTGNPVFPFFYEKLGGRGWDQWRADIYRNEQQSFGVGRTERGRDPLSIGASVLGLAYQPGRYINPMPTEGAGVPMGAPGLALVLGPLAFIALSGSRRGPWRALVGMSGLLLLLFFVLSQQVRYTTSLAPIWALLLGAAMLAAPRWNQILRGIVVVQAAFSAWLLWTTQGQLQSMVVSGTLSRREYQSAVVPFSGYAAKINERVGSGKVALYNEVFGYFLDVSYVWANPGHSTIIPYESFSTGHEFSEKLKELGFTHAYLNIQALSKDQRELVLNAFRGVPVDSAVAQQMDSNLDLKWVRLLCDAIASGDLRAVEEFTPEGGSGVRAILLEVTPNG